MSSQQNEHESRRATQSQGIRNRLWYKQPAASWQEALPLGNGRLGAMVFGDPYRERLQLNEDTLWSGYPRDTHNYEARHYLDEARRLIFAGQYAEAQEVVEQHMLGVWTQSYQPMGDLQIEFAGGGQLSNYERELDLETAICTARYRKDGRLYTQQAFASAVDQVLVVRLQANVPGSLHFSATLASPLNHTVVKNDASSIVLRGAAPDQVAPPSEHAAADPVSYAEGRGMRFAVHLHVIAEGGRVEVHGGRVKVLRADAATLLLTAATSFNGYDKDPHADGKEPDPMCRSWLAQAAALPYEQLRRRHIEEYRELFARTELNLSPGESAELATDERIEQQRAGQPDPQLAALFFQYGRYLLISSSRPGTQPATLQGIWNDSARPPWCCNYTTNINVQMNYWPAEPCNLAECHTPLFKLLEELSVTGQQTARIHYGCQGWAVHHGSDLWRASGPSDGLASWGFWPMAGPWLCQHLWEHYAFSCDRNFLREAYPIMKGAALFCLDWLVEDERGYLVTAPSTSPENTFIGPDGKRSAVSAGSTMDIALTWELFGNCIEASRTLDIDSDFRRELERARAQLPPLQIGRHGQLQEWLHDFEEAEPGHRHVAHIYPLHPGSRIHPWRDPELAAACRTTLARRARYEGQDTIGWCFSWNISIYARLLDGEKAHEYLTKLLRNPFPNLLNAHRHPKLTEHPTTLEANYAASAGIAELLLQSHAGELHLLPALPNAWPQGSVRGLRARGGFEVDMQWERGKLVAACIHSRAGQSCTLRTPQPLSHILDQAGHDVECRSLAPNLYRFDTRADARYRLVIRQDEQSGA